MISEMACRGAGTDWLHHFARPPSLSPSTRVPSRPRLRSWSRSSGAASNRPRHRPDSRKSLHRRGERGHGGIWVDYRQLTEAVPQGYPIGDGETAPKEKVYPGGGRSGVEEVREEKVDQTQQQLPAPSSSPAYLVSTTCADVACEDSSNLSSSLAPPAGTACARRHCCTWRRGSPCAAASSLSSWASGSAPSPWPPPPLRSLPSLCPRPLPSPSHLPTHLTRLLLLLGAFSHRTQNSGRALPPPSQKCPYMPAFLLLDGVARNACHCDILPLSFLACASQPSLLLNCREEGGKGGGS